MVRIVLDTDVLVCGLISNKGASFRILSLIPSGLFKLLLSVPLFLEYESVLKRKNIIKATGLTVNDIDEILNMIVDKGIAIEIRYLWRPTLPDPNDDMIIECAINGSADYIVTFNKRHFEGYTEKFRPEVVNPGEFINILRR